MEAEGTLLGLQNAAVDPILGQYIQPTNTLVLQDLFLYFFLFTFTSPANFFLDIFQIKCRAYFSLHHVCYVLSPHHHPYLMSLILFSIQHKLYSSAQISFYAVYKAI
jgi:hypothetical protein